MKFEEIVRSLAAGTFGLLVGIVGTLTVLDSYGVDLYPEKKSPPPDMVMHKIDIDPIVITFDEETKSFKFKD